MFEPDVCLEVSQFFRSAFATVPMGVCRRSTCITLKIIQRLFSLFFICLVVGFSIISSTADIGSMHYAG